MDKVAQQIEEMTGTKTAIAVEGVTLWQRLIAWVAAWWAVRSLPKGQRYVRAGFKAVTLGELAQRFSISKVNRKLMEEHFIQGMRAKGCNLQMDEVNIYEVSEYRSIGSMIFKWREKATGKTDWANVQGIRFREGVVKTVKLDEYVNDEIPSRCLASVKRAKDMGLSKFYVAYPSIEEVPQKDPVIISLWQGKAGDAASVYLEIDMWE